jgi:hypothetical protein
MAGRGVVCGDAVSEVVKLVELEVAWALDGQV